MVVGNVHVLLDQIGDSMEGGGLGDIDVTAHDGLLKKVVFLSLQAPV